MTDLSWDRGRLEYFDLHALAGFCRAVSATQATRPANLAEFKRRLTQHLRTGVVSTGAGRVLSFPAGRNDAWRNYGRVYRPLYLVYESSNSLELTSLANLLLTLDPDDASDREQFYAALSSRLRWPNPGFAGYSDREAPVYQLHVVIKLLLETPGAWLSLTDLARFLWWCGRSPNGVPISGAEAPRRVSAAFAAFQARPMADPPADRLRDFREMLSLFVGPLFEMQRGNVTLSGARLANPGDTLARFCDPNCCLARPNPDRDVEIQLRGSLSAAPAPPPTAGGPSFRRRPPRLPRARRQRRPAARPRSRIATRLGFFTYNAQNQIEAERRVRDQLIQACGAANLIWFARSTLESAPYEGLDSPGSDGRVFVAGTGVPDGYHEVKSKSADQPFQFTRSEIRRILDCARRGIGYHVWEVIFRGNGQADVFLIENVQALFAPNTSRHDALAALFDSDPMPRGCQLAF